MLCRRYWIKCIVQNKIDKCRKEKKMKVEKEMYNNDNVEQNEDINIEKIPLKPTHWCSRSTKNDNDQFKRITY